MISMIDIISYFYKFFFSVLKYKSYIYFCCAFFCALYFTLYFILFVIRYLKDFYFDKSFLPHFAYTYFYIYFFRQIMVTFLTGKVSMILCVLCLIFNFLYCSANFMHISVHVFCMFLVFYFLYYVCMIYIFNIYMYIYILYLYLYFHILAFAIVIFLKSISDHALNIEH